MQDHWGGSMVHQNKVLRSFYLFKIFAVSTAVLVKDSERPSFQEMISKMGLIDLRIGLQLPHIGPRQYYRLPTETFLKKIPSGTDVDKMEVDSGRKEPYSGLSLISTYDVTELVRHHKSHGNSFQNRTYLDLLQRLGVSKFEWLALQVDFTVHKHKNPPLGYRCEVFTFNRTTGEIENGFFYAIMLTIPSLSSKTNIPPILSSVVTIDELNLTVRAGQLHHGKWETEKIPTFFLLFDRETGDIFYQKISAKTTKRIGDEKAVITIPLTNILTLAKLKALKTEIQTFFQTALSGKLVFGTRPKRIDGHMLGDLGVCYFEYNALLANFKVERTQESGDYGIDLIMSTFSENFDYQNGAVFVQIKSEKSSTYTSDRQLIFYGMYRGHLEYFLSQQIPVFLVVYDMARHQAYWCHIQNEFNREDLKNSELKTFKVGLPHLLCGASFDEMRRIRDREYEKL